MWRLASLAELIAYDAPRFGGDRGPLIASMLADTARPLVVARARWRGGRLGLGATRCRPASGRWWPTRRTSRLDLVADALRRLPTARTARLNLPAVNRAGADRLRRLGAELEPWDGRMARGAQVPRREDTIYGNAVGALG